MKAEELTIEHAQRTQPWTQPYARRHDHDARDFRSPFLARHTLAHLMKSVGKLAAIYEAVDHSDLGPVPSDEQIREIAGLAADCLTAALKFANLYSFSLARELIRRVQDKNGVVWP